MQNNFPIVVLLSGRGSNFQALTQRLSDAHICAVISDKPEAPGLEFARDHGIKTFAFDRQDFPTKIAQKEAIYSAVDSFKSKLIVLAGFMQIIEAPFVERNLGRILNIHPSLLPRHPGLHTHERALEAKDEEHGCTVHFVDAGVDTGPVVAQAATKIVPGESAEALAERVLALEHDIYPWAVSHIARGEISISGREVSYSVRCRAEADGHGFRIGREACPQAAETNGA